MKKTGTFFLIRDNLKLGLILGLITPFIVFMIVYYARFSGYNFDEFIDRLQYDKQFAKTIITFWGVWCLVGNIALFTFYINTSRDKTAKGIFAISVIYGIGILLLKLFI